MSLKLRKEGQLGCINLEDAIIGVVFETIILTQKA